VSFDGNAALSMILLEERIHAILQAQCLKSTFVVQENVCCALLLQTVKGARY
jgi:hypothetical protein